MNEKKHVMQQNETITTTSSDRETLLSNISSMFDGDQEIKTNFLDEDIPNTKNNIGCQKCDYSGYIMKLDTLDYCTCYLEEKTKVKARKARIPKDYLDYNDLNINGLRAGKKPYSAPMAQMVEIYINKDLEKIEENFKALKEGGWNFIIEGPVGTGKTTFACLLGKMALKNDLNVLFLEMEELRKLWTGEDLPEELKQARLTISSADVLILDDLGKEFNSERSDFFLTKLDSLIRTRNSEKKMTIYTTNLTQDKMAVRYDNRLFSLLQKQNIHYILQVKRDLRTETTLPDFLL